MKKTKTKKNSKPKTKKNKKQETVTGEAPPSHSDMMKALKVDLKDLTALRELIESVEESVESRDLPATREAYKELARAPRLAQRGRMSVRRAISAMQRVERARLVHKESGKGE